jgi:hypothetical protein
MVSLFIAIGPTGGNLLGTKGQLSGLFTFNAPAQE